MKSWYRDKLLATIGADGTATVRMKSVVNGVLRSIHARPPVDPADAVGAYSIVGTTTQTGLEVWNESGLDGGDDNDVWPTAPEHDAAGVITGGRRSYDLANDGIEFVVTADPADEGKQLQIWVVFYGIQSAVT